MSTCWGGDAVFAFMVVAAAVDVKMLGHGAVNVNSGGSPSFPGCT